MSNNYYINIIYMSNKKNICCIGTRAQVMHGNAKQTGGGLKKKDLKYNKRGKIVSKKASAIAKKEKRLQKAGYKTKKGEFTLFSKQIGGSCQTFGQYFSKQIIDNFQYDDKLIECIKFIQTHIKKNGHLTLDKSLLEDNYCSNNTKIIEANGFARIDILSAEEEKLIKQSKDLKFNKIMSLVKKILELSKITVGDTLEENINILFTHINSTPKELNIITSYKYITSNKSHTLTDESNPDNYILTPNGIVSNKV
jgi:hypothetical protein